MIKIALCDNQKIFLNNYASVLKNMESKYNYNIEIFKFSSGEELLKDLSLKGIKIDIIFLDIIMDGINGIEVAKKIKDLDDIVEIVFLTNSKEHALEGYDVKPYNYIIKSSSLMHKKMEEVIHYVYYKTKDYFIVNNQSAIEKLRLREIIYIESNKRKVLIHTVHTKYEMYEKLDNIYEKIKHKGFIKSHRSYITNIDFIRRIESRDIITTIGNRIPISRSKVEETKFKFIDYIENKL